MRRGKRVGIGLFIGGLVGLDQRLVERLRGSQRGRERKRQGRRAAERGGAKQARADGCLVLGHDHKRAHHSLGAVMTPVQAI